ncbi:MAG: hypothetical protein CBD31_04425 [Flavobacteriaceae bacterium TMED171]|nr:hypothetical protein [Flavobacteriaceae bacterium]OUW31486.1 MAG: hypothetical protein CBD31_04425 [Flavobacteriaceae bacterium TMED171]|tara:strand:+ start:2009 stop:2590 length:582 start_codon:yes stop_codon:yes gene_type:complete
MFDLSRSIEDPALGYVFSVSAINSAIVPGSQRTAAAAAASAAMSTVMAMGADAEFQSISGIKATRETETYRPLGMNNRSYQLPTITSFDDLVLERGVVKKYSDFTVWCNNFINLDIPDLSTYAAGVFGVAKKIILVFLWDRNKYIPLMTWTFFDAVPKSIEYSSINAKESNYAVEKITIAYSNFFTTPTPVPL